MIQLKQYKMKMSIKEIPNNSATRYVASILIFAVLFGALIGLEVLHLYSAVLSSSAKNVEPVSTQRHDRVLPTLHVNPGLPRVQQGPYDTCDASLYNAVAEVSGRYFTNPLQAFQVGQTLRYFNYDIEFPNTHGSLSSVLSQWEKSKARKCVLNPSLVSYLTRCQLSPRQFMDGAVRLSGAMVHDRCSIEFPRCKPQDYLDVDKLPKISVFDDPVFIISLKSEKALQVINTKALLQSNGLSDVRVSPAVYGKAAFEVCQRPTLPGYWRLTQGELGIRQSFQRVFYHALVQGHERIMIVEDDILLRDDFKASFVEILNDPLCGGFLYSKIGGVLLLGASDYELRDRVMHRKNDPWFPRKYRNKPMPKCYDTNTRTHGAFAAVYHRNVFLPILQWLEDPNFAMFPFDHIYPYLSMKGFVVKVAYPYLALAETIHSSLSSGLKKARTDNPVNIRRFLLRTCSLRWNLQQFQTYRKWLEKHQLPVAMAELCSKENEQLYSNAQRSAVVAISDTSITSAFDTILKAEKIFERLYPHFDGRTSFSLQVVVFVFLGQVSSATRTLLVDWPSTTSVQNGVKLEHALVQYDPSFSLEDVLVDDVENALKLVAKYHIKLMLVPDSKLRGMSLATARSLLSKDLYNRLLFTNIGDLNELKFDAFKAALYKFSNPTISWTMLEWDISSSSYSLVKPAPIFLE